MSPRLPILDAAGMTLVMPPAFSASPRDQAPGSRPMIDGADDYYDDGRDFDSFDFCYRGSSPALWVVGITTELASATLRHARAAHVFYLR